jgi:hypothetical protein
MSVRRGADQAGHLVLLPNLITTEGGSNIPYREDIEIHYKTLVLPKNLPSRSFSLPLLKHATSYTPISTATGWNQTATEAATSCSNIAWMEQCSFSLVIKVIVNFHTNSIPSLDQQDIR